MTNKIIIAICLTFFTALANPIMAGEKQDAHISYVIKNAKLTKEEIAKVKPLLAAYYKDRSEAKANHKALKGKLETKEDAGKLSAAECDQLFESKQKQEHAELDVKKKHYAKLKTVVSTQKAYLIIKLCDDKVK